MRRKNGQFIWSTFSKNAKEHLFRLNFYKICLRPKEVGCKRVSIVIWESSENHFGRP